MSGFCRLTLKNGEILHVRPDMVKAVYDVKLSPPEANVVIDGHDFVVRGRAVDILDAVQFHIIEEGEP